jgi:hypothetical protein
VAGWAISLLVSYSCNPRQGKEDQQEDETYVKVVIDSTYYAMNPMDLQFDSLELVMIDSGMAELISDYRSIRAYNLPNSTPPALQFNPLPYGFIVPQPTPKIHWKVPEGISKPSLEPDLAFMSIPELASLIRSGEISCLALTEFFLNRLKKYDPQLHCVVTLTEAYAIEQAKKMDAELAAGRDRGILHGIPYGAKDLFAFPGYPTTWGAGPYREQVLDETAGRYNPESMEPGGRIQRLFGRVCCRHSSRAGTICDRNGDLGIHCLSLHPMRDHRSPPHLRKGDPVRGHGPQLEHG